MNAPWNTKEGTVSNSLSADPMARAKSLAIEAMEAVENSPASGLTDYQCAQADYEARLNEIRLKNQQDHVAANNARAELARQRKEQRQAEHEARNAAARQAANERRLAKAA